MFIECSFGGWGYDAERSWRGRGGLSVALNWWQGPELLGETHNAYHWARPYLQALRSLTRSSVRRSPTHRQPAPRSGVAFAAG